MDVAALLCVRSVMTLITLQLSVKDVCVARAILSALTVRDVRWDRLSRLSTATAGSDGWWALTTHRRPLGGASDAHAQ